MYFSTDAGLKPGLPFYKTVLCLVCVLILIVNGVSLAHNLQSLNEANALQNHGARVADKVQSLNVLVTDAESNLRGFFLSGSDSYLRQVRSARGEATQQFSQLRDLLADNPNQLKNLAQLENLVRREFAAMDDMLRVYRIGGLGDVAKITRSLGSDSTVDEIRLVVVIIAQEQRELLAARSAAYNREYRNAVMLGIGINLVAILVILLFYRLIRRSFFSRVVAQRALEHANQNLESMVAVRTEQLSVLSRHLISVAEEEKSRLARELHDEMGANLTAISIDLNAVAERLKAQQPQLAGMLERARATLVDTVQLKRRIVEDLRPSLLDNLGLSAAVQSYCNEFSQLTNIDCEALVDRAVDSAGPMHAIAAFRIVQEALNNVAKYAKARTVIVHLAVEEANLVLEISDDGVGIAVDAVLAPKSHGLLGMRERALLLGGSFVVRRGVNERGTCIDVSIPLRSGAQDAAPCVPAVALEAVESIDIQTPQTPLHKTQTPAVPASG
ncbi:MAG: histidine kinase [Massilia sp.]|nr:histidine kinase [Massilia sp.]